MALAAALVTGRLRWQTITFLQVVLGAAMVVAIGWLVAAILPEPLVLTPSLLARTSPGLLDLGVALAAGAAGAYVAARRTGADALPGVAIAVSLVPPLATVGICLRLGRSGDAGGAMNLFLTNFIGIVVVASIVFLILGAAPSREQLRERRRLRNGFVLAMIGLIVVAIPLAAQGYSVAAVGKSCDRRRPDRSQLDRLASAAGGGLEGGGRGRQPGACRARRPARRGYARPTAVGGVRGASRGAPGIHAPGLDRGVGKPVAAAGRRRWAPARAVSLRRRPASGIRRPGVGGERLGASVRSHGRSRSGRPKWP